MAHTPGPWQASGIRVRMTDLAQQWLVVTDANGQGFAYIPYSDRTPADHVASHADQRLIAAAPDLVAALREAIDFQAEDTECLNECPKRDEYYDDDPQECPDGRCRSYGCMVMRINRWRAALARAEGK